MPLHHQFLTPWSLSRCAAQQQEVDTTVSTHTSSLSSVSEEADPEFQQQNDSKAGVAGHGAMLEDEGLCEDTASRRGDEDAGGQQTDKQPSSSETNPSNHAHQSHAAQTGAHLDPDASPHRHPANISSHLAPRFLSPPPPPPPPPFQNLLPSSSIKTRKTQ